MKSKIELKKYILLIIGVAIIVFASFLGKSIYHSSFDQYVYSLLKSVGTSVTGYGLIILFGIVIFLIVCTLFIIPTIDFGKKIRIGNKQIFPIKNVKRYNLIIFCIGIIYFGAIIGFFSFAFNGFRESDLFEKYYVSPSDVKIEFPENKRNLIYIFMESTEMSNVSKVNGGVFDTSIMPNLEQLALDNINFSNNNKLGGAMESYGATWTVAAMIAQTSGVPLKLEIKDYEKNSTNFGNIVTLGDILSTNGYDNYLLMGSDANFGGRKAYFDNHNYVISDYNTAIEENKIDSDYHEWWGYEDNKLYEYAKEKLLEISNSDKPFNLTLLTADTHFTDGYVDSSCEEVFDSHYANSFYCSDKMLYEFIKWIQEQDFYDNTTIIITGDHHTMQTNFYEVDNDYTRVIFNTFINVYDSENINNKNRVFTTMDMFPTTLGALGADIEGNRLGLGTDLFSNKKTISEMIGIDSLNKELKKNSDYYYNYIRK